MTLEENCASVPLGVSEFVLARPVLGKWLESCHDAVKVEWAIFGALAVCGNHPYISFIKAEEL